MIKIFTVIRSCKGVEPVSEATLIRRSLVLTKSLYKLACECPTKLYYQKNGYTSSKSDDPFLEALADGGHKVGELAKQYYPGGVEVSTHDHEDALEQTTVLLEKDTSIIYEGAVRHQGLFIRADILIKDGVNLKLIEVKSKSYSPNVIEKQLLAKNGVNPKMRDSVQDIAFQKYVLENAFPNLIVTSFLLLADTTVICQTSGLNQKIRIKRNDDYGFDVVNSLNDVDIETPILREVEADDAIAVITNEVAPDSDKQLFVDNINILAEKYGANEKISSPIARKKCNTCEFTVTQAQEAEGLTSGFKECWKDQNNWGDTDFKEPNLLDYKGIPWRKVDSLFSKKVFKVSGVIESNMAPKSDGKPGLSESERGWKLIQKIQKKDKSIWIDNKGMLEEFNSWRYPLSFIDFETSRSLIPYHAGRRPNENIIFQFSHHTVDKDQNVAHVQDYINLNSNDFPNYEFVRQLKKSLDEHGVSDGRYGTIFKFSPYENTCLREIALQLGTDVSEISDRDELLTFIKDITQSKGRSGESNMVDLCEISKRYYLNPETKGSNSIKDLLPAILGSSDYLKQKYSSAIYGAEDGVISKNFENKVWIEFEQDGVTPKNPYKLLPPVLNDLTTEEMASLDSLVGDDSIDQGAAAMMAYTKCQYDDMEDLEREQIKKALLRYCELDTLAMVMLYEGWREMIK